MEIKKLIQLLNQLPEDIEVRKYLIREPIKFWVCFGSAYVELEHYLENKVNCTSLGNPKFVFVETKDGK